MQPAEPWLELATRLAWPAVALLALVLLRRPLGSALEKLLSVKLKAGGVELETVLQGQLPPAEIQRLGRQTPLIDLEGRRLEVAILYSELRGLTRITEKLDPKSLAAVVNDYAELFMSSVFRHGGTLDRSDARVFTAFWGAPDPATTDEEINALVASACAAALEIRDAMPRIDQKIEANDRPAVSASSAITVGSVWAGAVGSGSSTHYSILGEGREVLPDLARLNDEYGCDILLTSYAVERLLGRFDVRHVASGVVLKSKSDPIGVFELVGERG
jgi:adenylate cyclase